MAKFTSEEVIGLQGGGNENARKVYFKEWDWNRQYLPSDSNIEGLRRFIKHLYVDRRYTGEKTVDSPRTPMEVDRENSLTPRSGRHNLPYLDVFKRRGIERSASSGGGDGERDSRNNYDEKRNPENGTESQSESQRRDNRRRIAAFFEGVDESCSEHVSETTKSETYWYASRLHNLDRRPSNHHKALDSSKPREVRPLREILDRIPSLRKSGTFKEDIGDRPPSSPFQMQRAASSICRTRQVDENSMEPKRLNSMGHARKNLENRGNISSYCEPALQAQQSPKSTGQSSPKPTDSPNSMVKIDCPPEGNQSKAASNAKKLDSVVPAAKAMGNVSTKPSTSGVLKVEIPNTHSMPSSGGVSPVAPLSNMLTSSPASRSPNPKAPLVSATSALAAYDDNSSSEVNQVKREEGNLQPQCSRFPNTAIQSTSYMLSGSPNLQPQQIHQASSEVVLHSLPPAQTFSYKKEFPEVHGTGPVSHSGPSEQISPSGRKELPQHLFTAAYSSAPVVSAGWQRVQGHAMGYGSQYTSSMQVPTVYQQGTSANAFDLNNMTHLQQSLMVSPTPMASWHGAHPNLMAPTNILQSNNFGSPSAQWMPVQSSAYGAMPFQPLSSTSGPPLSSYMGQQLSNNLPSTGYQGAGIPGDNLGVYSTYTSQQPGGRFPNPTIQTSYSSGGGNPFA
ncbi:putative ADP-ribosylation factor GTPase-activating protein AGD14-like protein [Corchorus olitorius]|uniref:ADP-ribosylation factor GTPase-activating protein AGD14-like protein n=1 Tax=Corchorus olitorius TaxID=93759 RepID=A0A1R3H8Z3_9ROSI|nr:putative ADP-ribosylation factor GTPase-activating protein AGD14-like protein [Corchorus olitorius]